MAKYHSGVSMGKGIKVTNSKSKMTPRQTKFAKGLAGVVNRTITFDKK